MKRARGFVLALMFMGLAQMACAFLAAPEIAPPAAASATPAASVQPTGQSSAQPSSAATAASTQQPSAEPASATPAASATPFPSSTATAAPLALEIVQSQAWTDNLGDARANVVFRNPYDFPVSPGIVARVVLRSAAGDILSIGELRFLDGISGGGGFIMPGETIAANTCFTCLKPHLTEDWAAVEIVTKIAEADSQWEISTEVEAKVANIDFDGDSAIFWATGSVTNHSDTTLQRIAVRVIVYDQAGQLTGTLEGLAEDVAPGATANFRSYGIGQTPSGAFTYDVSALGVNY